MTKNTKIMLVIIAAVVLSVLAGLGVYKGLQNQQASVYIYNGDYPAGTPLAGTMFTKLTVNATIYEAGQKARVGQVFATKEQINNAIAEGDKLRYTVYANQIAVPAQFVIAGGNSVENQLEPDKIAVTINLNNTTGVTYDLARGSHVNVFFTRSNGEQAVLQNMYILKTSKADGSLTSITLQCDFEQAALLTSSSNFYCGLVNSDGYQYYTDDINEYLEYGVVSTDAKPSTTPQKTVDVQYDPVTGLAVDPFAPKN